MKNAKSILDEIEGFLEYIAKANEIKRREGNLKKTFGEKRYKAIYDLIGGKYTGALLKRENNQRFLVLYINPSGLKYLEERKKEKTSENQNKVIMFLTAMLVLTTIAGFFNELEIIKKGYLMIIYSVFALIIASYFKFSQDIRV